LINVTGKKLMALALSTSRSEHWYPELKT